MARKQTESTTEQTKPMTKDDYISVGYHLAESMTAAEKEAEMSKRRYIMEAVKTYRSAEQIEAILLGVAKFYTEQGATDSTIRVRKSEVKAVFDAVAKTEVSEDSMAKLEAFTGGYNAWIAYARELRGKNEPRNTTGRGEKVQLTKIQEEKVHESIADASNEQRIAIASDAVHNIIAQAERTNPEKAQLAGKQTLIALRAQAELLAKSDKFDKFFQHVGQQVFKILDDAIKQVNKAEEEASKVKILSEGDKLAA